MVDRLAAGRLHEVQGHCLGGFRLLKSRYLKMGTKQIECEVNGSDDRKNNSHINGGWYNWKEKCLPKDNSQMIRPKGKTSQGRWSLSLWLSWTAGTAHCTTFYNTDPPSPCVTEKSHYTRRRCPQAHGTKEKIVRKQLNKAWASGCTFTLLPQVKSPFLTGQVIIDSRVEQFPCDHPSYVNSSKKTQVNRFLGKEKGIHKRKENKHKYFNDKKCGFPNDLKAPGRLLGTCWLRNWVTKIQLCSEHNGGLQGTGSSHFWPSLPSYRNQDKPWRTPSPIWGLLRRRK